MTKKEGYRKAILLYGFFTLCHLLDLYEQEENYEECQIIYETIKEFNDSLNINLPTKYDTQAKEYLYKALEVHNLTGDTYGNNLPVYIENIKQLVFELK